MVLQVTSTYTATDALFSGLRAVLSLRDESRLNRILELHYAPAFCQQVRTRNTALNIAISTCEAESNVAEAKVPETGAVRQEYFVLCVLNLATCLCSDHSQYEV